jgi:RNA polymerase sigma factor (sigma-70 family)
MDTEVSAEPGLRASQADERLRRRLEEGDEAAYEELWRRFAPGVRRYATARLGGDEELAEDIAVQTLSAAVGSVRSFNHRRSSFPLWLYGIARRVVIAELRMQRRSAQVPKSAEVDIEATRGIAADGDLASDLSAQLEARRKVTLLAGHLSDAEMEMLVLHFVEEFSVKEIAHLVRRSERAVYSLLHRAKVKARERLAHDAERA